MNLAAFGTPEFQAKQQLCSQGLLEEHRRFANRMREQINTLPPSSKRFWKLSDALAMKMSVASSIPPLRAADSSWILWPKDKAELFSSVLSSKLILPEAVVNELSQMSLNDPSFSMSGFLPIRVRLVAKLFKGLDASSGTGPDALPARILKMCHAALAVPVALLVRLFLISGVWPTAWKRHWLFPLYKKRSKSEANNYRGIHLTSQLSKVAERCLGFFAMLSPNVWRIWT